MKIYDTYKWIKEKPPEIEWLIDKLLPKDEVLLISGETGVGKSLLRTQLAILFAKGGGEFLGYKITGAPTLVVQHENSIAGEWRRIHKLAQSIGIYDEKRFLLNQAMYSIPNAKEAKRLENVVRASNAKVVIYDCLGTLHTCNENSASEMRAVCEALKKIDRECGTSSIIIHHFRKPSDGRDSSGDKAESRGSSSISDFAGFIITVRKASNGLIKIKVEKTRDSDEEGKELICKRDPNTLLLEIASDEAGETYDLDKILSVLKAGPIETRQAFVDALLDDKVASSERTARRMIEWAVRKGSVNMFKDGNKNIYALETKYALQCKGLWPVCDS